MNDDHALLQRYIREQEEAAFRTLVSRYAGLVYSTALRHVREPALAEEVAQNVFTLLAMKGRSVPREASLAGWLHKSTCHLSSHLFRSEARRRARESAAVALHPPGDSGEPAWSDLQEVLDESLSSLKAADREALLLRFMRGLSLREVSGVLRTSEDGARMKINRALEKLRGLLVRRGITSTSAALSGTLAAHAVATVPAELTQHFTSFALGTSHTAQLTQIALMSTKAKVVFVAAGAALTVAIGTPVIMQREKALRAEITNLESRITGLTDGSASAGLASSQTPGRAGTAGGRKTGALSSAAKTGTRDVPAKMPQSRNLAGDGKGMEGAAEAVSGMMKASGMKELMKSQTKPIVEKMYADLLDGLWQLNPEQREKALNAFLEPMSEAQVAAMDMLQGGRSEEKMKELNEKAKAANEKRDATLKEILNDPEKFAQLARYEESAAARMQLTQLREALSVKDASLALNETQEEKLMNMMHQAGKDLKADAPPEQQTGFDPAAFTEEALNARKAKSQALQEKILADAKGILKPEQLEVLKESLK
ncbi:MAG TPA: sigma-70 family RNA polymerase sigma factor, partial [Verrucomicrobiales bacterium]|nr:sigma-70 family RNA polymerase sigma factor [Verrucomicrobiales bacterium]